MCFGVKLLLFRGIGACLESGWVGMGGRGGQGKVDAGCVRGVWVVETVEWNRGSVRVGGGDGGVILLHERRAGPRHCLAALK